MGYNTINKSNKNTHRHKDKHRNRNRNRNKIKKINDKVKNNISDNSEVFVNSKEYTDPSIDTNIFNIIRNLYIDYSLDEDEISKITEKDLKYTRTAVKRIKMSETYLIETAINNIYFRKLKDNRYMKLREKMLPIWPDYCYGIMMSNYFTNYNIFKFPAICAVFYYYFGGSSRLFDNYKGSFRYLFLLDIENKKTKNKYEYIMSIEDINGSIYFQFYKIEEGHPKDKYMILHKPFPDFTKKEMEKVWLTFFSLVKNTVKYFEKNEMLFFPFCHRVESQYTIYGYTNNKFFNNIYYDTNQEDYGKESYDNDWDKYSVQIKKEKENCNIKNDGNLINRMLVLSASASRGRFS